MPLLEELLSKRINKMLQSNEYGVSLVNLPNFSIVELCKLLNKEKTIQLFLLGISPADIEMIEKEHIENTEFYFTVEAAEDSRNSGDENKFRIIVILRNDIEKITSLEWFNKISMDTLYSEACKLIKNESKATGNGNKFIEEFMTALNKNELKKKMNFVEVVNFLSDYRNSSTSSKIVFFKDNLYKIGLCKDSKLFTLLESDMIKQRIIENKNVVISIGDLDKQLLQNIHAYAVDNPGNPVPNQILDYYKHKKNNEYLKDLELEDVILCIKKSSSLPGKKKNNKKTRLSPTAFGAKLVFENKTDTINEYLEQIKESFDGDIKDKECKIEYSEFESSIKYDQFSHNLVDEFTSNDLFGVVYYFDTESPIEAVSNRKKHECKEELNSSWLFEYVIKYLKILIDSGLCLDLNDSLNKFLQSRELVVKHKIRLKDYAMLEILNNFNLFSDYLSKYEKLLSDLDSNYRIISEEDHTAAKEIISCVMSMDFTYFISPTNKNYFAIPSSIHPLYLWKYIKLAEEMLLSKNIENPDELNYLSDDDKNFIIRKSEDIPNPLSLFYVPHLITDSEAIYLPLNGNLGMLPVYSNKQLIDDSYSNSKDIQRIIDKYIDLYPHSQLNIKLAFVNPPSVDVIGKAINDFDINVYNDISFDIVAIKTKESSSKDWFLIDESTMNAGILGKSKNNFINSINLKIIDKVISYDEIDKYISSNRHIIFMFDPNEKKIEMSINNRNIHIHPLCIPKVYEYKALSNSKTISTSDNASIFTSYSTIIERLKEQSGASIRSPKVFNNSPLNEETYKKILTRTDWIVVFDKNLKIWDIALNSVSQKLFFTESDSRSIGIYSNNSEKIQKGYKNLIYQLGNFFPDEKGIIKIIDTIRTVNNNGLLSIISKSSNNVFDYNQGKGSLGLAITAQLYKSKFKNSIIVGLDTQLARAWLSNREEGNLPDLIAIRQDENNDFIIDVIEVKSYHAYKLEYSSSSNIYKIEGDCVNQVTVLNDLLREMFSSNEKITTVSRREILREQVFDYIFNIIVPIYKDTNRQMITSLINEVNDLFAGKKKFVINKNISHVNFENSNTEILKVYYDATKLQDKILLNVIGQDIISKILRGETPLDNPFFEFEKAETYVRSDTNGLFCMVNDRCNAINKSMPFEDEIKESIVEEKLKEPIFSVKKNIVLEEKNKCGTTINSVVDEELKNKCKQLYVLLKDYGISLKPIDYNLVQKTSRFIRFQIELMSGETIRSIEKYKEDISRGLESLGPIMINNVRGTRYIAIDVCYKIKPDNISLLERLNLLDSSTGNLDILAGESTNGDFKIIDLTSAVHMLIAGTTGSGKTIFLYNIICSLLYKHDENDLDLVIIDPKQTDFVFFNKLKCCHNNKVITDIDEAVKTIKWINEVEKVRRTNLLVKSSVRDITAYNQKNPNNKMKRMVVIIDEYADMIMSASNQGDRKALEGVLCELAQRVRNIGIHFIIATQRPSASIVTSSLKTNIPFRISFKLPQHQDSMTILDTSGAEDLLGKGDMLVMSDEGMIRLQSCFINADNDELSNYLKKYE